MTDDPAREDALRLARFPERVFFANGALLDETDFRAEQDYHRTRLARLAAYLHGAGTVAGLLVRAEEVGPDERELVVEPGLALDRIGRMIELAQESCLRLGRWLADQPPAALEGAFRPEAAPDQIVVDVFLAFHVCEGALQPAFASRDMDALDAVQPSRIRDHGRLGLELRERDADLDERRPSFRPRFRPAAEGEPPLELE
ncbi:MAG TPA: hypothetical protein VFG47_12865, partial [Geminicoccaceae bacterium]|nr:hypothetical protein [Geminicoccaceae bacterium]